MICTEKIKFYLLGIDIQSDMCYLIITARQKNYPIKIIGGTHYEKQQKKDRLGVFGRQEAV